MAHLHHDPVITDPALGATDGILLVFAAFVLGLAGGLVLAVQLRNHTLRWSWALLTVVPLALVLLLTLAAPTTATFALLALALGIATSSIAWGLRAELEDRRAGGDRLAAAASRRGPLDRSRRRRAERGARAGALLEQGIPIGRTHREELATLPRGDAASGNHLLIPGATGAGKTTSLASVLVDYVARSGFGAVVLEAKNDSTLLDTAREAAARAGRSFHLFSPAGEAGYDPLAHGSVDERSERLIAVEGWGSADADFYRQAASPFLRLVLRSLDSAASPCTLASVAHHCDPTEIERLKLSDPALREEVRASVDALGADQKRAIAGLQARLQNLASSEFARRYLDPTKSEARLFDLRQVVAEREVAYFRFDTDRTGNVGRAIAQMVLLDLGACASDLMGRGAGTFIAIDEFGALEAPALDRLYARGRAAGFSVAVGTQTLADLAAAGPAVRERIGATISGIVCHRIGEQADAEWVSELTGALPTWQSTIRTDGLGHPTSEGTRTRGYRFEVNPSELQRLGAGEAYVIRLDRADSSRARRVRVVPPWERLASAQPPARSDHRAGVPASASE